SIAMSFYKKIVNRLQNNEEKNMKFSKTKNKIMSTALLLSMLASSAPQGNVFALAASFTVPVEPRRVEENNIDDSRPRLTWVEKNTEGSEAAENEEAEAESESVVQNDSESVENQQVLQEEQTEAEETEATDETAESEEASDTSNLNTSSGTQSNVDSSDDTTANQLTADNHTSEFITLDKTAIGFTQVGDTVTVTATLADGVDDEVEWMVRDSSMLSISPVITSANGYLIDDDAEDNSSTADITWLGGTGETSFFARLKSNPDEYVEGTAIFFDSSDQTTGTDVLQQESDTELKTEFESPEIEEFLREMYNEGLTQDNSNYDLSVFANSENSSSSSASTDETDAVSTYNNVNANQTTNESTDTNQTTDESTGTVNLFSDNAEVFTLEDKNGVSDEADTASVASETASNSSDTSVSYSDASTGSGAISEAASTASENVSSSSSSSNTSSSSASTVTVEKTEENVVTHTVQETHATNVETTTTTTTTTTTEVVGTSTAAATVEEEVPVTMEKEVPVTVTKQVPVTVVN
ncbi:MAG: hypothetical protein LIO59_01945, partial [Oscillospiraceae bacterium]|nr:hypothetical protein [Oscillospiraceae bacterium]